MKMMKIFLKKQIAYSKVLHWLFKKINTLICILPNKITW